MLDKLKNEYKAVMFGRNGMDELNRALLAAAAGASLLQLAFSFLTGRAGGGYAIAIGLVAVAVFRFLSRNTYKRGAENMMFTQLWTGLKQRIAAKRANRAPNPYRTNPYRAQKPAKEEKKTKRLTMVVSCKKCGQKLRVPKGKGKIRVFCQSCGEAFEMKS